MVGGSLFLFLSFCFFSFYSYTNKQQMRKIINTMVFKIGFDIVASLEMDNQTIFDTENFKCILATQYDVSPEEIDVSFEVKEVLDPIGESFVSITGKLCFYNDSWNAEVVQGLSFVDWLDLTMEEGINTLSDYKYLGKSDELVKFN